MLDVAVWDVSVTSIVQVKIVAFLSRQSWCVPRAGGLSANFCLLLERPSISKTPRANADLESFHVLMRDNLVCKSVNEKTLGLLTLILKNNPLRARMKFNNLNTPRHDTSETEATGMRNKKTAIAWMCNVLQNKFQENLLEVAQNCILTGFLRLKFREQLVGRHNNK